MLKTTGLTAAGLAAASTFTTGNNYRLLIYNTNADGTLGSLVSSTLLTMGNTPNTVDVNQGTKYTWFAYSYNDSGESGCRLNSKPYNYKCTLLPDKTDTKPAIHCQYAFY